MTSHPDYVVSGRSCFGESRDDGQLQSRQSVMTISIGKENIDGLTMGYMIKKRIAQTSIIIG